MLAAVAAARTEAAAPPKAAAALAAFGGSKVAVAAPKADPGKIGSKSAVRGLKDALEAAKTAKAKRAARHKMVALEQQIKRLMRRFRTFSNLIEVDRAASLRLKSLAFDAHPIHPVEIACLPEVANETVVLTAHPEDRNEQIVIPSRVPPQKDSWLLDLRMGVYDMSARFPGHEINDPPDKEIFVHSDNVSEVIEVS